MSRISKARTGRCARGVALSFASLLAASPVAASTHSTVVFRAEAVSASGDGVVEVSFDQGVFDPASGVYNYSQLEPVDVVSEATGETVATLTGVELWLRTG